MANKLINEQSPYLLQHAHNPVDWYPWGDEPFQRAEKENKPVLVSIGYAACHWCHVMERESFENSDIAAFMNEHFICIKVDREEHPDVDHMYMDAVQAISGSGGWPLNVFVTPGRVPFFGGTYYPPRPAYNRPSWMQLLERINEIWTSQQEEAQAQAQQMLDYLQNAANIGSEGAQQAWDMDSCRKMAESLLKQADKEQGGFGQAPKFPGTMAISFLLEHYHYTGYQPALDQALLSLDKMVEGGIYDQLGGGFARYATDNNWLIPHFEKMLYDSALLILSLCDAYSITKRSRYKEVIEETIAFVERELKNESGGYYSALDADSEGVEGKYYTFTWQEWINVLGNDREMLDGYFGVSEHGNWEETNILHVAKSVELLASENNISTEDILLKIKIAKEKLFAARQNKIRPITDDKSLLSWNALMSLALTRSAITLSNADYLQRATEHMVWMEQHFCMDDGWMRCWKNGKARIAATLDDYAYLVQAMLQLASATGENIWIQKANKIAEITIENFLSGDGTLFYFSSKKQKDIPVRKVDVYDGALPSANAVMAHNLMLLGICMGKSNYDEQAFFMLQKMSETAFRYAYSFGYWGVLLQRYAKGFKSIICTGKNARKTSVILWQNFIPQAYVLTSEKEIFDLPVFEGKFFKDETPIFVCTQQACLAPVKDVAAALVLLNH